MRVKLKENAISFTSQAINEQRKHFEALKNYLTEKSGQWIEIDTSYLHSNQYNSVDGYKILDQYIEAVEEDARIGAARCNYCGKSFKHSDNEILKHHQTVCINKSNEWNRKHCDNEIVNPNFYIDVFTPENTYFLYRDKLPQLYNVEPEKGARFGTYFFYTNKDRYHVIHNSRQTLKFLYDAENDEYIDMTYTVGYNRKKSLPIPADAAKKLKSFLAKAYSEAAAQLTT
jgi:hypothetical protein